MLFAGIFGTIFYTLLASKCIQARQQSHLKKFKTLEITSEIFIKDNFVKCSKNVIVKFGYFMRLHANLLRLCKFNLEYFRYCKPLLSIILPYFIVVQCYMLYAIVFVESLDYTLQQILIVCLIEMDLFLFIIVHQCAKVDKLNKAFEKCSRKFFTFLIQNCQLRGRIHVGSLMKVSTRMNVYVELRFKISQFQAQTLQTHKRLHIYAFRLTGNYRITSNTLILVIFILYIFIQL